MSRILICGDSNSSGRMGDSDSDPLWQTMTILSYLNPTTKKNI